VTIGGRESKDGERRGERGKMGWRVRRICGGSVVPNWDEMVESQKEIHSPSTSVPLPPPSRHSLRWRFIPRNDFASRAEIFVPSFAAMRCSTALFFLPGHCFCPLRRADQRGNISSFEDFNVFGRHVPAGSCHRLAGREMMDLVKLNDGSRHLFLTLRHSPYCSSNIERIKFLLP